MKIKEYVVPIFVKYEKIAYIRNNNILQMKYCTFTHDYSYEDQVKFLLNVHK